MGLAHKLISLVVILLAALTAHVQAAPIVVGQVGPASGLDANQSKAYLAGMQLVFSAVNKAGGVNGHTVSLVSRDDGGSAEATARLTKQMLQEDKPMLLAGYFGDKNLAELVKSNLLADEKIALVGYRTSQIRGDSPNIFSVRAGLRDEVFKITEHLATIGIGRLGLLYEEGPETAALLAAAEEAAKASNVAVTVKASFAAGTAKVAGAVETFTKTAPQAIIMVCSGAVAASFIDQYRAAGGIAQLFATSGTDVEQLARLLSGEQMQGVAIAQVVPNPYRISTRLSKELSDILGKGGVTTVPLSYPMMEGFITAKVIVEAVRRSGSNPTRANLAQALAAIDNLDLGGYVVGFKSGRSGSKYVELSIVSGDGKIRQ